MYELLRTPGALLVDGSADASWSRAVAGRQLRRVLAPGAGSLLIRPDGIVAWTAPGGTSAGTDSAGAAELGAAVAAWVGEPAFTWTCPVGTAAEPVVATGRAGLV